MPAAASAFATWFRSYRPASEDAARLVCFPHAGGSASFFFPLAGALAPGIGMLAAQYPARQDRRHEPVVTSLSDLADQCFAALRPALDDRPTALFGHSMGALLAYEVALRMQDAGLPPPVRLFASGRRAPSRYRDDAVHRLPASGIVAQLRRLSGTHAEMLADAEVLSMILPAVRSDYQAVETYRHVPGRSLECPLTVLTGADDPLVTAEEAQAWTAHTTAPTDVHVLPGGHFFLVDRFDDVVGLLREIAVPAEHSSVKPT